jgi:hypothetical protein
MAQVHATCTEVLLRLQTTEIPGNDTLRFYCNDSLTDVFRLQTIDTLLWFKGINPGTSFLWRAEWLGEAEKQVQLNGGTLDTTSHDFSVE